MAHFPSSLHPVVRVVTNAHCHVGGCVWAGALTRLQAVSPYYNHTTISILSMSNGAPGSDHPPPYILQWRIPAMMGGEGSVGIIAGSGPSKRSPFPKLEISSGDFSTMCLHVWRTMQSFRDLPTGLAAAKEALIRSSHVPQYTPYSFVRLLVRLLKHEIKGLLPERLVS